MVFKFELLYIHNVLGPKKEKKNFRLFRLQAKAVRQNPTQSLIN